jgi:hypothetical protein
MTNLSKAGNPYRFSRRVINVTTGVLVAAMLAGLVTGIALGVASDGVEGDAGETLSTVALWIVVGSFLVPLAVAAVLGGEAIKRGGGLVGALLMVGITATAVSRVGDVVDVIGAGWSDVLFWGGIVVMALAVAAFWIVGWVAKVPMWLQLPMLGSPRIVVRDGEEERRPR